MEELNLHQCIRMIFKNRRLVFVPVIISIVIGLTIITLSSKKYEATAILITNPIKSEANTIEGKDIGNTIKNMGAMLQMDIVTYKEQVLSNGILSATIAILNLNDGKKNVTQSQLKNKIKVSVISDTNLLKITVSDKDPQLATDIANTISNVFIDYVNNLIKDQSYLAANIIKKQLDEEQINIDQKSKELRDYLMSAKSIDELKSNIKSQIEQISKYKSDLNDIERQIYTDDVALTALGKNSSGELADNALAFSIPVNSQDEKKNVNSIEINLANKESIQSSILAIEAGQTEVRLVRNQADYNNLKYKIGDMEKQLAELQSQLAEEEYKYNNIQREYLLAEETYNAYQSLLKQTLISSVSDIGKISIQVSSQASLPTSTVNESALLVMAICVAAGIALGVCMAIFKEYWLKASSVYNG